MFSFISGDDMPINVHIWKNIKIKMNIYRYLFTKKIFEPQNVYVELLMSLRNWCPTIPRDSWLNHRKEVFRETLFSVLLIAVKRTVKGAGGVPRSKSLL
jgi:hypothetical protein